MLPHTRFSIRVRLSAEIEHTKKVHFFCKKMHFLGHRMSLIFNAARSITCPESMFIHKHTMYQPYSSRKYLPPCCRSAGNKGGILATHHPPLFGAGLYPIFGRACGAIFLIFLYFRAFRPLPGKLLQRPRLMVLWVTFGPESPWGPFCAPGGRILELFSSCPETCYRGLV